MERHAVLPDFNFESNTRNPDEGRPISDYFHVYDARRYCPYDTLSPVHNAAIKVDIPDKHDYAANLEVEVMWRHAGDVNRLEKFNRGNIVDIIRTGLVMVFALCKVCIRAGKRPRMWSLISSVLLFVGAKIPLFAKVVDSAVRIPGYTKSMSCWKVSTPLMLQVGG